MQFIRINISVIHCHDIRVTLHRESQLAECILVFQIRHSPALLIYGIHSHVHQILSVSMPGLSIRHHFQRHCLARSLYLMASHNLAILPGHSQQSARRISDAVPLDASTQLRVVTIFLHTQTLAVQE